MNTNHIHLDRDFGWFVGSFDNNQEHRHYALQLSIPLEGTLRIQTASGTVESAQALLIRSQVPHKVLSDHRHFLLLMNPASTVGHFWSQLAQQDIRELSSGPADELRSLLLGNGQAGLPRAEINALIGRYDCFCSAAVHQGDPRISDALAYLSAHADQVLSLEAIAGRFHLSPSRFLHLFKQETGITFRRAQLWNKVIRSLPLFGQTSFTEIAHEAGFADSAHLSRVFKENFGFSPRDFLKISQFIQE